MSTTRTDVIDATRVHELLQQRYGDGTLLDLFKRSYMNGHGPTTLTREENGIVQRDFDRFNTSSQLPPYVTKAIQ